LRIKTKDRDSPTEAFHLQSLAGRLKMPDGLVAHLNRQNEAL